MVNYDFSTTQTLKSDYVVDDLYYLNMRSGINLGRLATSQLQHPQCGKQQRQLSFCSTYLQRDIASLRSQIMMGGYLDGK